MFKALLFSILLTFNSIAQERILIIGNHYAAEKNSYVIQLINSNIETQFTLLVSPNMTIGWAIAEVTKEERQKDKFDMIFLFLGSIEIDTGISILTTIASYDSLISALIPHSENIVLTTLPCKTDYRFKDNLKYINTFIVNEYIRSWHSNFIVLDVDHFINNYPGSQELFNNNSDRFSSLMQIYLTKLYLLEILKFRSGF